MRSRAGKWRSQLCRTHWVGDVVGPAQQRHTVARNQHSTRARNLGRMAHSRKQRVLSLICVSRAQTGSAVPRRGNACATWLIGYPTAATCAVLCSDCGAARAGVCWHQQHAQGCVGSGCSHSSRGRSRKQEALAPSPGKDPKCSVLTCKLCAVETVQHQVQDQTPR